MANLLKTLSRNIQKNRARREEEFLEETSDPIDYEDRIRQKRIRSLRRILSVIAVVVLVVIIWLVYQERRTYKSYKVVETSEQEDIISTKYIEMDGNVLRYSPDGVSLEDDDMDVIWTESYSMQKPVADVRKDRAVIADRDGTSLQIFNSKGRTGSVTTTAPIMKARVSSSGMIAAILDGGDDTWINFYGPDGSLIVENQTRIDDPGFPMDVAISNDGVIMMVTYQFVDGGETTSYVAFYNFGEVGQNEDDRIVSGFKYTGTVIPEIEYLSGSTSIAVRDDGFTLYKGSQIPEEEKTISVDQEIVSVFYNEDTVGLVFRNDNKNSQYTMDVYNADGEKKFSKNFNIPYTSIRMSDDYILLYNSSQMAVMNSRGVQKYAGNVDGTIRDFFKIGSNRYLLILDSGVNVIRLS